MKFILEIDCDNAAFDPDPAHEVAHILHTVAMRLDSLGETSGTVRDVNGNTVGRFALG